MSPSEQAFYRHAGLRIRANRVRIGMSQERLAMRLGCGRTTLIGIERGRQGVDAYRLGQLAHVFGITADALIRGPVPENTTLPRTRPGLFTRLKRALS